MKTYAFLAAALALTCACSSSSERPSSHDERQTAIQNDREQREYDEHDYAERADRADQPEHHDHGRSETAPAMPERDAPGVDADGDRATRADADAAEHAPDNTGRNARDDEPGNLTALDQSNSASDVDITQAIRKKVVADDALSFNAKNVKIITVSGKVTLRGPVKSAEESKAIEQSARAVPGVVQVDNQIEVKR